MRLGNTEVYVAPTAGPAVFGWWHPQIVLPAWLAQAPSCQRELALAHEQAHLDARDPQLLAVAFGLLAVMPWNLPLWWQLHRLRCAIEVDCDQRVLRGGGDLVAYGETLIELSQHQFRQAGLMAAVSQPQSFLERRIRIMSSLPRRRSRTVAFVLAALALGVVAVAAELAPPPAPAALSAQPALAARPAVPAVRAVPAGQAVPALPAIPALPALAALPARPGADAAHTADADDAPEADDVDAATQEAESAAERAEEAKQNAEEAEAAAHEAMHDAEEQMAEAQTAKREAEAAAAEARARKQEAEAVARSAHAQGGSSR